jgi:hypothetical protein
VTATANAPASGTGRPPAPGRSLAVLAATVLCLAGLGCARLSVSHLEARPFAPGGDAVVTMKYWRFAFAARLDGEAYCLRGRATPVPAALPVWADRLEEISVTAYLRDADGTVLASAAKTYRGMALGPDAAIPFDFRLIPDSAAPPGGLSVSFGYQAVYGSSAARQTLPGTGPPPAGTLFFAGEGALLRQ